MIKDTPKTRDLWLRDFNQRIHRPVNAPVIETPDTIGCWCAPPNDANDDLGAGTRQVDTPGAQCAYLATYYGRPVGKEISSASFGSPAYLNSVISTWKGLHTAGTPLTYLPAHTQASAIEWISMILSELPGDARIAEGPNGYATLVAMSRATQAEAQHASVGHGGLHYQLDFSYIELLYSPLSEVINELEISYNWDEWRGTFLQTLKVNQDTTDDGLGQPLLATTGGGLTVSQLCEASIIRYGERKPPPMALRFVKHESMAAAYAYWTIWNYWRPPRAIHIIGGPSCLDIYVGQVIVINNSTYDDLGLSPASIDEPTVAWEDVSWYVTSAQTVDISGLGVCRDIIAVHNIGNMDAPMRSALGFGEARPVGDVGHARERGQRT